ncbi:hypothetical protein IHQ68_08340 [Chelatococcus sambhunathii]|uniref:Uncharacterized protein n=1 Tax=Chelatococcus sambhunathii TaxID=363953 RepID=A0ABU1DEV0_9HYPH|nr:hypothetical protein [Chelatococcus sambhunathii]MDR4306624.1 hypothetical protein [Chelatococcus sambhunathii]
MFVALVLAGLHCGLAGGEAAPIGGCAFDAQTQSFKGAAVAQATCLLRKVKPKGSGATVQPIPDWLKSNVDQPVTVDREKLKAYLSARQINAKDVGLSGAIGVAPKLRYFVIHDTSWPEIAQSAGFPANIDASSYSGNKLANWTGKIRQRVNAMVARDGASEVFQAWGATRPLPATKLEQTNLAGIGSRAVFVHVENVQPRLKPTNSFAWIAPDPGLSPAQEERLALAYVVASFAAGRWLVPAYHFNIDEGLPNGHDDPQGGDLASWVQKVENIASAAQ